MREEKKRCIEFLRKHNNYVEDINFIKCVREFEKEMELGLIDKSSLQMIPTYLSIDKIKKHNEKVIVIDAGGTNFRTAVVEFDADGNAKIKNFSKHRMPGTSGELSVSEFFAQIADLIRPLKDESDKIGFCFSYPLEITEDKDGRVIYFTKELKVKNGEGELVAENLQRALGGAKKNIVLLNDTVAALLGGVAAYPDRRFSSYAGYILGTGSNTAYIEKCSNIKKVKKIASMKGNMIINLESGGYDKAPCGDIDKVLTANTINPNNQLLEKKISGAYLGMNLAVTLKVAAEEGFFSKEFSENIQKQYSFTGEELQSFFSYPYKKGAIQSLCQNDMERLYVYYFAEHVSDRAAKFAAINLAAVVSKSGAGNSPLEPVCILTEGSTYHKGKFIKERIDYYLRKYLNDEMGCYGEITEAEDVTLIGSAIAGLCD